MYDIDGYGEMITDRVRMKAYAEALRACIRPDSVVLDLGTGAGILALIACRLGARRVHAIEPSPIIQLAREIASANGMTERIDFHQGLSTEMSLPERVDVIVSDLRGVLPLHEGHLPAIIDARRRFLSPGGVLIPRADRLWAAIVESPELHRRVTSPWFENDQSLDMGAGATLAANIWRKARVGPEQLVSEPVLCGVLDYANLESSDFQAEIAFVVARSAPAHGFCLWFDAELAPGVGFSNAPGEPELIYGSAHFRWPRELQLAAGERVTLRLDARLVAEKYVWAWETVVEGKAHPATRFRQSTFYGKPMTVESLRRKAEGHVPQLGEPGEVDRFVLERMLQRATLGEISRDLARRFPSRFADWRDALRHVGDLSSRYGA